MTIEVRVPQLPESVADATLVVWHKQPGDPVGRDENLADLETDKVVLEVPAPVAGVLTELRVVAGTTVTSGALLAIIDETATVAKPAEAATAAPSPAPAARAEGAKLGPAARRLVEEKQLARAGSASRTSSARSTSPRPRRPRPRRAPRRPRRRCAAAAPSSACR